MLGEVIGGAEDFRPGVPNGFCPIRRDLLEEGSCLAAKNRLIGNVRVVVCITASKYWT
jgi:hypothetical protein